MRDAMGRPLSEDARNSLTALVSVTLFFGIAYVVLSLLRDVELPRWTPFAVLGLSLLNLMIGLSRWRADRRNRKKADLLSG